MERMGERKAGWGVVEVKGPQVGSRGELLGEPASCSSLAAFSSMLDHLLLDLVQKRTSTCPSIEWGHQSISSWGQWEGSVKCRVWVALCGAMCTQQIDLLCYGCY